MHSSVVQEGMNSDFSVSEEIHMVLLYHKCTGWFSVNSHAHFFLPKLSLVSLRVELPKELDS